MVHLAVFDPVTAAEGIMVVDTLGAFDEKKARCPGGGVAASPTDRGIAHDSESHKKVPETVEKNGTGR